MPFLGSFLIQIVMFIVDILFAIFIFLIPSKASVSLYCGRDPTVKMIGKALNNTKT